MREILFRAKNEDNGKWHYGDLRHYDEGTTIIAQCAGEYAFIDPDTVGQYTGLTDENGKKIFEGDILNYQNCGFRAIGVARFGLYSSAYGAIAGHVGFYLDWVDNDYLRSDIGFWAEKRPIFVIGNIHDNPELVGGTKKDA